MLRKHHAPAIGFVNEAQLQVDGEVDARIALLRAWIDSGMTLGNHTFAHVDYNAVSIQEYEDDIVRGEVVTRRLMLGRALSYQPYFRGPRTHTGNSPAKKHALEQFLKARGYTLAPHTVENSDFLFNRAYLLARRRNHVREEARIRRAYLDFTVAALSFAEQTSSRIFGRDIPQTFLLHSNAINADCLDQLIGLMEARGYRAISLDSAMADASYHSRDTLVTSLGPTWLWRWMKSKGMKVSFSADPEPPSWIVHAAGPVLQPAPLGEIK